MRFLIWHKTWLSILTFLDLFDWFILFLHATGEDTVTPLIPGEAGGAKIFMCQLGEGHVYSSLYV